MRAAAVDLLRPRLLTGPRLRVLRWRRVAALAAVLWLSTTFLWGVTAVRLRTLAREMAVMGPSSAAQSLPPPPDVASLRARLDELRSLERARRWSGLLPGVLDACSRQGVAFSQVAARPDGVAVSGSAPDLGAVARCAEEVARAAGARAASLRSASRCPAGSMTFELHLAGATPPPARRGGG